MERVTLTQTAQFFYLRVKLEISKENDLPPVQLDALTFKSLLLQALDSLHGKIGAALNVDVLKFNAKSMEAIVRVRERGLVKLWSAMTLFSYYQDRHCAITVIQCRKENAKNMSGMLTVSNHKEDLVTARDCKVLKGVTQCLVKMTAILQLLKIVNFLEHSIKVKQQHKVSPHLLSLAADSRQWKIEDGLVVK